jgi:hypothetical protein
MLLRASKVSVDKVMYFTCESKMISSFMYKTLSALIHCFERTD